jgi:hypothetical protein
MKPTRAAWFFAAGLGWLVARALLVKAFPAIHPDQIFTQGGPWLLIPLVSFLASLTPPYFFLSLYRAHDMSGDRGLRWSTIAAVVGSVLSSMLVLISLVLVIRRTVFEAGSFPFPVEGILWLIPFSFVLSMLVFFVFLSRARGIDPAIRSAARVAAAGTAIPILMMLAWAAHRLSGGLSWYPGFSQGLGGRILGLAAAAALFFFLETFATRYRRPADDGP